MLRLRHDTEDWREQITGWVIPAELHDEYEHRIDELADELRGDVLRRLTDAGIDHERAYEQRVGSGVIVQSGSGQEEDAFDDALAAAIAEMKQQLGLEAGS